MVETKASIFTAIGILTIVVSVMCVILIQLYDSFCNIIESCTYPPLQEFLVVPIGFLIVGGLITIIGVWSGGTKKVVLSEEAE